MPRFLRTRALKEALDSALWGAGTHVPLGFRTLSNRLTAWAEPCSVQTRLWDTGAFGPEDGGVQWGFLGSNATTSDVLKGTIHLDVKLHLWICIVGSSFKFALNIFNQNSYICGLNWVS